MHEKEVIFIIAFNKARSSFIASKFYARINKNILKIVTHYFIRQPVRERYDQDQTHKVYFLKGKAKKCWQRADCKECIENFKPNLQNINSSLIEGMIPDVS